MYPLLLKKINTQDTAIHLFCIPKAVTFRPPLITQKPMVYGPQTAFVVGPKGEEIFTDNEYRVKVQFHWDREGKNNESSSCWVRVKPNMGWKRLGSSLSPSNWA